eukprot:1703945-Amphidinium_carterae.1
MVTYDVPKVCLGFFETLPLYEALQGNLFYMVLRTAATSESLEATFCVDIDIWVVATRTNSRTTSISH